MIPVISSLTPYTTAVPLMLVLALTAVKDAYDDYVREIKNYIVFMHEHTLEKVINGSYYLKIFSKDMLVILKSIIVNHLCYEITEAIGFSRRKGGTRLIIYSA